MTINKNELFKAMEVYNYSQASLARKMKIDPVTLYYVLNDKRKAGNKFINGLKLAFPDEVVKNIVLI
ncbi:XRE family transcriptional regulator [Proteiniclasticum sp. SCR006]|uniref:XRE family transcriptional regulator n=1 Tax=Proteiniclasticum aestuarii TaxID=2817862 RepID=A0A939H730_9CLOT|nr:XRE family transcriptional regulator [Proteiniclasticum aestuarii]MBO1264336.1 XRE family transcriptional regulator [Proteiniclasticum aestuarii]